MTQRMAVMNTIKLFCFPYAGGSATAFNNWKRYLSPSIKLLPVELRGRGRRVHEPLYRDMIDAVEDVFNIVSPEIGDCPYAFFGHSMGGSIAYNVAQMIQRANLPSPAHIFFSARKAPHINRDDDKQC